MTRLDALGNKQRQIGKDCEGVTALDNIYKKLSLGLDRKNLIVSALEDELEKVESHLNLSSFNIVRIPGVKEYSEIPDIIKNDSSGANLYLIKTDDVRGEGLLELYKSSKTRLLFDDLHTVFVITQVPVDGMKVATGVSAVKVSGNYIDTFNTEI